MIPWPLDKKKPKSNINLADKIINNNGCLISEYSSGSNVDRYCFVERDRIQSSLSTAILVIKADEKSGTMNAVKKSLQENKAVYQLNTNLNSIIHKSIELNNENISKIVSEINNPKFEDNFEQISLF